MHNLAKYTLNILEVYSVWMENVPSQLFPVLFANHVWFSFQWNAMFFFSKKKNFG